MEKYGRGWQRLPSWVGDDRQLIQPGGRPAKGGQMLGFFFTPWRTWPLGGEHPAGEGGCGVGDPRIWGVGWTVAGRWVEVGGGTAGAEARQVKPSGVVSRFPTQPRPQATRQGCRAQGPLRYLQPGNLRCS